MIDLRNKDPSDSQARGLLIPVLLVHSQTFRSSNYYLSIINKGAVAFWSRHLRSLDCSDGSLTLVVVLRMDDRKNAPYRPEMRWVKSREVIKIPAHQAVFADNLSPIQRRWCRRLSILLTLLVGLQRIRSLHIAAIWALTFRRKNPVL
jgi:hypothetical protein